MKKIINGKVYDTETAEQVGAWDNGYPANDFNYCSEDLYRKKTGEFFLYCEGGALSRYGVSSGNNRKGSNLINPISYEYAQKWAEENLAAEKYEELFGEVVEDERKKIISMSLTVAAHEKLRQAAGKKDMTISALIEEFADKL